MTTRSYLVGGALAALAVLPWCAPHPGEPCSLGECADAALDDAAPPGCDLALEPKDSPACVHERVGIFVSTFGDDASANGSRAKPFRSMTRALAAATGTRIYVCAGTYDENPAVDGAKAITGIYGGFSCDDWSYTGIRPKVSGTVRLNAVSGFTVSDLAVASHDATAAGGSSIALAASMSTATVRRVTLTAGSGAAGTNGTITQYTYPSADALKGKPATDATTGGIANPITCPGGATTVGGKGGNAGFDGETGETGPGNAGTIASCQSSGSAGGNGRPGPAASNASGAATTGTLDDRGWTPTGGNSGQPGGPGQGGGGGGGFQGAGGGGGAGGCGGAGGGAGGGGGASIAVASLQSRLTFVQSELTSRVAGAGGTGAAAQAGQAPGGVRGTQSGNACAGGIGGAGGSGGAGGGGAGGVAVGIVYKGEAPSRDSSTSITVGSAGAKGAGGAPGANDGVPGIARAELQAP